MMYTQSLRLKKKSYITVYATDSHIHKVSFIEEKFTSPNKLTKLAIQQIEEYFNNKRRSFNLPLKVEGTEFQQKVWKILEGIEFGKYLTYKDIAQKVGGVNYSRAVGMACNKNPLPIVIPCHRVLGSGRVITGYAGGLPLKKELLDLENVQSV